ncbi:MAG TPA: zincin-like metallopeptidase domain-containing protein [Acetobacteraceae bacterium]|nr:zincin-like metallopeptidase domain-containing protein [Acetobacteraceae bacterium]
MNTEQYAAITDRLIADLEHGVRPWHRPWNAEHMHGRITRPLRHNGQPYSGINVILLWCAGTAKGHSTSTWMTFKQAKELGGHVRKGEHGETVVYADRMIKTETNGEGEDIERVIPYLKAYTVFNLDQIDGLPERYLAKVRSEPPEKPLPQRIEAAEAFFAATKAQIRHGGNRAFYAVEPDFIQMPPFEAFQSPEAYYGTLAHESTHWTKHRSRLDRDFGRLRWGDEGYAKEELVAEIASAYLCSDLGITPDLENNANYLGSWLTVLKNDKRFIFSAAGFAEKAVGYLHGLQSEASAASEHSDPDMALAA